MDRILVGVVTKPQALKGEFRIKPDIKDFKAFKSFDEITIGNKNYTVEKVTLRDAFVIVKVEGVNSCEEAESLRNSEVYANYEISEDYVNAYEGYSCFVDELIGRVVDVSNYGSKDVMTIKGSIEIMLPIIDNLIIKIDNEKKEIFLDKNIFMQVASYED